MKQFNQWRSTLSKGKGIRLPLSDGSKLYVVPMQIFRPNSCSLLVACSTGGTMVYGRRRKPSLADLVRGGFDGLSKAVEITDFLSELFADGKFMTRKRGDVSASRLPLSESWLALSQ